MSVCEVRWIRYIRPGYGIVMPSVDELSLEAPEIVRQGGRYGVRLRASAPSIHLMRANIKAEVNPIVGTEKQSEELVHDPLSEFEEQPEKIWDTQYFREIPQRAGAGGIIA